MEAIQLTIETGNTRKFAVNPYKTNKKFIDIKDYDSSTNILLEIQHKSMNTFLNLTSLNNHILITFDETGKVVLRTVCKSSDDTGEFIISTQEKKVLIITENNLESLEGVVSGQFD